MWFVEMVRGLYCEQSLWFITCEGTINKTHARFVVLTVVSLKIQVFCCWGLKDEVVL